MRTIVEIAIHVSILTVVFLPVASVRPLVGDGRERRGRGVQLRRYWSVRRRRSRANGRLQRAGLPFVRILEELRLSGEAQRQVTG